MENLPSELLHLITDDLPLSSRWALTLSCRRLHDFMLPALYSDVTITRPLKPHQIPTFLRTLTERPSIAALVQTLRLEQWETPLPSPAATFTYNPDTIHLLINRLAHYPPEKERWHRELRTGCPNACLLLVLALLPNLRYLHLKLPLTTDRFTSLLWNAKAGILRIFPKLEEVHISRGLRGVGLSVLDCLAFFYFPSIRVITASSMSDPSPLMLHRSPFSNIQHIDLRRSTTSDGMNVWLECCLELKSFRFSRPLLRGSSTPVGPFRTSLSRHRDSLEKLWIECPPSTDIQVERSLGSFGGYTKLKFLYVWFDNLTELGPGGKMVTHLGDIVPKSLEGLCIARCPEESVGYLTWGVEVLVTEERPPGLKRVDLEGFGFGGTQFESASGVCEGADIMLRTWEVGDSGFRHYLEGVWP